LACFDERSGEGRAGSARQNIEGAEPSVGGVALTGFLGRDTSNSHLGVSHRSSSISEQSGSLSEWANSLPFCCHDPFWYWARSILAQQTN
jgi:hypothetical protein